MTSRRWLFFLLWLCLPVFPLAAAAELDDLLERVAAAYGNAGETRPPAMRQTGVTYSALRRQEGALHRTYQRPDRLRIEIRYPDKEEVRILRGGAAWKEGEAMSDAFHGAMVLQAVRLDLPWNLLTARGLLRDLGTTAMGDGPPLRILEWPLTGGLDMQVGIDPDSGRIVHVLGRIVSGGGEMEFGTRYEDFRRQDGLLYAAMERHYVMGRPTGYTRIEQVEFLDRLPDDLFEPAPPPPPRVRI
jgi:hypothetical protein